MTESSRGLWSKLGGVGLVVLAMAGAARFSIELPLTPVPQTGQTLVVLAAGIFLGARWGSIAMMTYLGLGVLGLPIFAAGSSGWERVTGPTGGFLIGFVAAAAMAGWWTGRGWGRPVGRSFLGMALAHAGILLLGWVWLAVWIGSIPAYEAGVEPFLLGGLVKSWVAGLLAARVGDPAGRRS